MDAPTDSDWLTREQIDQVIRGMSAADLIKALEIHGDKSLAMPVAAFDLAAERMGLSNGSPASGHVSMADFKYLGNEIAKAVNVESPLSEGQEA